MAEVERTLAEERSRASFSVDGALFQTAVEVSVTKQSGADAIKVIDAAKV